MFKFRKVEKKCQNKRFLSHLTLNKAKTRDWNFPRNWAVKMCAQYSLWFFISRFDGFATGVAWMKRQKKTMIHNLSTCVRTFSYFRVKWRWINGIFHGDERVVLWKLLMLAWRFWGEPWVLRLKRSWVHCVLRLTLEFCSN